MSQQQPEPPKQTKSSQRRGKRVKKTRLLVDNVISDYKAKRGEDPSFDQNFQFYQAKDALLLSKMAELDRRLTNVTRSKVLTDEALPKFAKTFGRPDATKNEMNIYFYDTFRRAHPGI